MRDYVRGLLGPVGRKNGWQLAEYAGHSTPHGLQLTGADVTRPPPDTATTSAASPVTNSRHMTSSQLTTLGNRPLTSRNSELQLEY
jgi:hypothetical protein